MGSISVYKRLLKHKFSTWCIFDYYFPYGQYREDLNSWFQHENIIWSLVSLQCCMVVFSSSCLRMMLSFNFHFVCVLWLKTIFKGEEWMPFCLNMEYPRYILGKLNACAFMCVMNSCKKMFIQLFSNETNVCSALQHCVRTCCQWIQRWFKRWS